jgi:hypothetical protein
MHEMHAEMHFGSDVKPSNFNQNGNVLVAFRKTPHEIYFVALELLNRDRCTFKHDELYSQLCSQTSQKE